MLHCVKRWLSIKTKLLIKKWIMMVVKLFIKLKLYLNSWQYSQALLVLTECHRLAPKNVYVCLQASQLCYEQLQLNQQGVDWAQAAIKCDALPHNLARGHMALGIGLCLVAKDSRLLAVRQDLNQRALDAFKK